MAGTFGTIPQPIALPNPEQDLSKVYPNLSGTNAQVSGDILSKLGGQLSPGTLQQLQNASATYGAANGMPGANATPGTLPYSMNLESIGINSEQQQQQGIQDYNSTIPTISGTQTVSPALQAQIGEENSINASAPDPAAANSYAESLYQQYLNSMNGGGSKWGGGGKGTASMAAPKISGGSSLPPNGITTGPSPGTLSAYQQGTFYNGVLYPPGSSPPSTLQPSTGNMFGGGPGELDPESGLPANLDFNALMASLGQVQPQGGDFGSGE